ncbi:MAG: sigma-54-dependent Fis family transcriptional regulator [Deltaproteobacteria bacterium]|nr:sigma-54-dependent Fis family transcriptional regulator [Deltaproteobacteria bacterium]
MARILVVDDEPSHRDSLRRIFERAGHEVLVADDGEHALELLRREPVHVVLSDLVMPRMDGQALLKAAKTVQPELDVVMMTAYGTVENAVAAMREGAYDFITKPTKRGEVLAVIGRALERQALLEENRALRARIASAEGDASFIGLVGQSEAMRAVVDTIRQVAPSAATVLLLGESGTGKELVARAIHALSPRAHKPFVAVNSAALPESILEAELFGAEKGAYTGALERRAGRFERADGGTLFLDEVGDLPLAMQPKLLRALQEGEIERLGGTSAVKVDVRVVAATHVDLRERVKQGLFREDLYYRLDVITVRLPPLREREGDVPLLAAHLLKKLSVRHGKRMQGFEPKALEALSSWTFPGNVRELENAVERAVVLCPGETLRLADLPTPLQEHAAQGAPVLGDGHTLTFRVGQTMEQIERAAIDATLRHTGGDKQLSAKLLGISARTLYRRLGERSPDAGVDEET